MWRDKADLVRAEKHVLYYSNKGSCVLSGVLSFAYSSSFMYVLTLYLLSCVECYCYEVQVEHMMVISWYTTSNSHVMYLQAKTFGGYTYYTILMLYYRELVGVLSAHEDCSPVCSLAFSIVQEEITFDNRIQDELQHTLYTCASRFYQLECEEEGETESDVPRRVKESKLHLLSGDTSGAIYLWNLLDLATTKEPRPLWYCGVDSGDNACGADANGGLFGDGCTMMFYITNNIIMSKESVPTRLMTTKSPTATSKDGEDEIETRVVAWDINVLQGLDLENIIDGDSDGDDEELIVKERAIVEVWIRSLCLLCCMQYTIYYIHARIHANSVL